MPTTPPTTFDLPKEIAAGLVSGKYRLFGGVVRDQAGHVVKMLDPVSGRLSRLAKVNPKLTITAGVVGALIGVGSAMAWTRFNKKARLGRQLAAVDSALKATIAKRPSLEFTRDDLQELQARIGEFLHLTSSEEYRTVRLTIDESARKNLIAFAEALRLFSTELASEALLQEPVPELPSGTSHDPLPLVDAIWRQLEYQQRHWPNEVT